MTAEDVKRFETLLDWFSHPGFKILCDEFQFKTEAIKEQFTVLGIDPGILAYGQGRISVYREIEGLPTLIRNALEKEDEPDTV